MKFLFDKIISALGLIVLSPVMALIAFLIKLKMPDGPVIFKQSRVGREGKLFTVYKFRTMSVERKKSPVSVAGDSGITPLGAKLRRFKLVPLTIRWRLLRYWAAR